MNANAKLLSGVLLLAAGCAGTAWFVLGAHGPRATAGPAVEEEHSPSPDGFADPRILDPEACDDPVRVTREAEPGDEPGEPEMLPPAGRLRFSIADSANGQPLDSASLRLQTETRFAELDGVGPDLDLKLSAGQWEVRVARVGYEDEVFHCDVPPEGRCERGSIGLDRGSAHIGGRVALREAFESPWVLVELRGLGRNPCLRCGEQAKIPEVPEDEEPADEDEAEESEGSPSEDFDGLPEDVAAACPHCGWSADSSILARRGSGTFSFQNLASGTYLLRVRTHAHPRGGARFVEVEPHGDAWVETFLTDPVALDLSLWHEDGKPFEGPPGELEQPAEAGWVSLRSSFVYHFWQGDTEIARATLTPPVRPGPNGMLFLHTSLAARDLVFTSFARDVHVGRHVIDVQWDFLLNVDGEPVPLTEARLDRRRQDGDSTLVDRGRPELEIATLVGTFLAPHLHRVEGLPPVEVTLSCECGGWRSERRAVDLSRRAGSTVALTMRPPAGGSVETRLAVDTGLQYLRDFSLEISGVVEPGDPQD